VGGELLGFPVWDKEVFTVWPLPFISILRLKFPTHPPLLFRLGVTKSDLLVFFKMESTEALVNN